MQNRIPVLPVKIDPMDVIHRAKNISIHKEVIAKVSSATTGGGSGDSLPV
jgi:hypothetical protein